MSVADVHYEPFGIYAGKTASLEELQDGAQIGVPTTPPTAAAPCCSSRSRASSL